MFDMGVVGVAPRWRSYVIVGIVARRARSYRYVHHDLVAIRRGAPPEENLGSTPTYS
jgi:hypothetical protein